MLGYKLKLQQGFQKTISMKRDLCPPCRESFVFEDSVSRSYAWNKSRTQSMHIGISKRGSPQTS